MESVWYDYGCCCCAGAGLGAVGENGAVVGVLLHNLSKPTEVQLGCNGIFFCHKFCVEYYSGGFEQPWRVSGSSCMEYVGGIR